MPAEVVVLPPSLPLILWLGLVEIVDIPYVRVVNIVTQGYDFLSDFLIGLQPIQMLHDP